MKFFTTNMKLCLQALGKQEFSSDPKVVAVFKSPSQDLTFYITEYRVKEDHFFGYVKGEGVDTWGSFPRGGIEYLHEIKQELPEYKKEKGEVEKPTPISELLPQLKEQIVFARLDRLIQEHKKEDGIER